MNNAEQDIDYYEVLQISRNAEVETIHRVYRMMATRFHPDNPRTGNTETFLLLKRAYQVLSDPVPIGWPKPPPGRASEPGADAAG